MSITNKNLIFYKKQTKTGLYVRVHQSGKTVYSYKYNKGTKFTPFLKKGIIEKILQANYVL